MPADTSLLRGREVPCSELPSLHGWFPVGLTPDPATVWWRFLGSRRFTEPFFYDTLASQPNEDRQRCATPLAALGELPDSVAPTAFIFHVSRCGSTLATQAFATLAQCIVLSEPPALDAFFSLHHRHPGQSGGLQTLRQLVAALGQRRDPREQHLVIKLDCWHLPWIDYLQAAFPATPMVLLYRQPDEVLASHRRQRGQQMVPGLVDLTRLEDWVHQPGATELAPGDLDGYAMRVLAGLYRCGLAAAAAHDLMLVNYSQLPAAIGEQMLGHLGVQCTPDERAALQSRSGFHSKHSHDPFAGDPVDRDVTAFMKTPESLDAANSCYEQLEQLRLARG